jgi:hypothetical protein
MPVHAGDLGLRVHDCRAGLVLHALAGDHRPDLQAQPPDLRVVRRHGLDRPQREMWGQLYPLIVGDPRLEREATTRLEIRPHVVELHDGRECQRDMRDIRDHCALGGNYGILRREDAVDPEALHEPAFLVLSLVA